MKIIETEFINEIYACEYNLWDEEDTKEHVGNCIKIADNHAIRFNLWMSLNAQNRISDNLYWHKGYLKNIIQLLEIFNKESDF